MSLVVPPDPLTVPTWLTAIFTGVLAVGAIVTAVFAILAFRKQSAELRVLQQQAKDQATVLELQAAELKESLADRKRQADERRRAQAEQVFMWLERPDFLPPDQADRVIVAHVKNAGTRPVNEVMIRWHRGHTFWGGPDMLPRLMPDEERSVERALPDDLPGNIDLGIFGAVVLFRDTAKALWRIRPDGSLGEVQPDEPADTW